ncbi:MAG TPA: metal ABC transporter ATP-binding protein [Devosia sp.]|jgi:zinc/manganese transport system ATP-binding protein|uniref:metal ABC transporter ATP-binding protein n=1 Tax=Devosia sp. TaxID=1871048 RepID=UPI002DDCA027|nr:metal ABC transporter ATP-binding protein [Devosia sp.]HEV2516104.1 metal ABC transporter ATP-binding protein [Devosia sp.]
MSAAITLDDVSIAYGREQAVANISGSFAAGSLTAIAGPNGAGKSTLLKAIVGELTPTHGRIARDQLGTRDLGYLPQAAEVDRSFPLSVSDTVLMGAWRAIGAFGAASRAVAAAARDALAAVGLEGFERRHIGTLSAGQFQRVLFARLMLQNARVILLDEPFTAIDARTTRDLLDIVLRWNSDGRTVIAVLHDFEQVRAHFPNTLLLAKRQIAWGPTSETLTSANLTDARAMAEAWPDSGFGFSGMGGAA